MKVRPETRRWAKIHRGDEMAFQHGPPDLSAVAGSLTNTVHNEPRERVWLESDQGPFVRRSGPPLAVPSDRCYGLA
jgi:hypothetical protein